MGKGGKAKSVDGLSRHEQMHADTSQRLGTTDDAKPKSRSGTRRKSCWTYVAQVSDNLPDPRFVQLGERASVLPQKMSEIAKLAEFRLDIEGVVLFPAVNVR
jgi:hypothetical protein